MGRCNQDLSRIHSDQGCSVRSLLVAANLILMHPRVENASVARLNHRQHLDQVTCRIVKEITLWFVCKVISFSHSVTLHMHIPCCYSNVLLRFDYTYCRNSWKFGRMMKSDGTWHAFSLKTPVCDPNWSDPCSWLFRDLPSPCDSWMVDNKGWVGRWLHYSGVAKWSLVSTLHGMQERCSLCDNLGCSTCKAFWSRRVLSILCSITGGQVGANCSTFTVVLWRWSVWCSEHCIPWSQDPWNTVARS